MANFVDVSDMDDQYKNANIEESAPDGVYQAEIVKAEFRWLQTKPPQKVFEWGFEIVDGDSTGVVIQKLAFLRQDLMKWLKVDMSKLDIHFQTLSEIQQHQRSLLGLQVEIKLVTKPDKQGQDRQSCWIQRLIKPDLPNEEYKSPPKEEDIPF